MSSLGGRVGAGGRLEGETAMWEGLDSARATTPPGMAITAPHCLHFPFFPANLSSRVKYLPQFSQAKVMLMTRTVGSLADQRERVARTPGRLDVEDQSTKTIESMIRCQKVFSRSAITLSMKVSA
jgi:hypothetical protein